MKFKFNMNLLPGLKSSDLARAISILEKKDRKKIVLVVFLQIFMGFLDLVGVALIGVLGALSINGIQSRPPGDRVAFFLSALNLDNFSFQAQIGIFAVLATVILMIRTAFSIFFARKVLFFLSSRGALISEKLLERLLSQSAIELQNRTSQSTVYAVTSGVTNITLGIIGTSINMIADVSLLFVLSFGLFLVDTYVALGTLVTFSLIAFTLHMLLQKRAKRLGELQAELSIRSNEKLMEVLLTFRENLVRDRRGYYSKEIGKIRYELADVLAEASFMPNISKYVIEISVFVAALALGATQFLLQDASHAIATLAIFLAAGTRIAPAVLRVQQGAIVIKGSIGSARETLDLFQELPELNNLSQVNNLLPQSHLGFEPKIEIKSINFRYKESTGFSIANLNLEISPGQVIAIVGPSGSGKTTLIDLILGAIEPDSGSIKISGYDPLLTIKQWPGSIGYVPQDVAVVNGSIRQNLGIGFDAGDVSDEQSIRVLSQSSLTSLIDSSPLGLEAQVGERGTQLSGGQRQRLGIARALLTNPSLLVLDEATSSLDAQTELLISESIQKLKGKVTLIMVAHRLSTVRNADQVLYMDNGQVVARGTFEEVRSLVPNFDAQAELMGL
ncbi:MdlB ABC-type multidrug transport system, ATPase and permease components [Candidatus Planktophila versatilis]|uniref:ABC transporter ATP-binding protein n=1 Tax=Candidatus Planktophila versatilis TaxID=1884905 RepID=UPI003BEEFC27